MRIILLLSTVSILANASYEKAKEYYDAKDYRNAIKEAKASKDAYSNPKLHLIWAKSEAALGNIKEAMSAYERVAILDAEDSESRLKLLQIYKDTKRTKLSKDLGAQLHTYELTPEQRSSLELLQGEDLSTIKAKGSLRLGYDSNINVSATATALDNYNHLSNEGAIGTLFTRLNGSVSYIHDLQERGGWYLRGDAKVAYQNNFDASYYNFTLLGATGGVGYAGDGYTLYLPLGYDSVTYLDRNLFGQFRIEPKLNMQLTKEYLLSVDAKYSMRSYNSQEDKGMDDSSYGIGVGVYYLFGKNFAYADLHWEHFASSDTPHYFYLDKDIYSLNIGANYHLTSWLVGRADYKYRYGDYEDRSDLRDRLVTTTRVDNHNQIELKFSHFFAKNYELFFSDKYVDNSSNYIPASYTKNIAIFGISANY